MKSSVYLAAIDNLGARSRILVVALALMVVQNIYNWSALRDAKNEVKIALVPIAGGNDMWVGNGEASPSYIRSMARYITYQIGNYQAATARKQFQELLSLFPPEKVGAAQDHFNRLAAQIERYPSITSVIRWAGDDPLKYTSDTIQVMANKDRLVNGKVTESETVYYCIKYRITDTQFVVDTINERGGSHEKGVDLCMRDKPAADAGA